jgi:hypothetical protein
MGCTSTRLSPRPAPKIPERHIRALSSFGTIYTGGRSIDRFPCLEIRSKLDLCTACRARLI